MIHCHFPSVKRLKEKQIEEKNTDHEKLDKEQLKRIRRKYKKYKQERGAEIKKIFYIQERSVILTFTKMQTFHRRQSRTQLKKGKLKTNQALRAME